MCAQVCVRTRINLCMCVFVCESNRGKRFRYFQAINCVCAPADVPDMKTGADN